MDNILAMIEDVSGSRRRALFRATTTRDFAMPWLYATRLHALLDCYQALGGDISPWRKQCGVLKI
jgi:hypothetical protein